MPSCGGRCMLFEQIGEPMETQDRTVMETKIAAIHRKMPMPARQLPINGFAHKATVIGDLRVQDVPAAHDRPAGSPRAATLDRRHPLQLAETDVTCIGLPPSRSMVAEDIRRRF